MVGFCKLLSALALLIHLFYDALFVTLSRIRNFRRLESRARLLKPRSRNLAKFRIYHSTTLRSHNCTRLHHGYGAFKGQSRLHEEVVISISQSEQTYCKFNSNDKNTQIQNKDFWERNIWTLLDCFSVIFVLNPYQFYLYLLVMFPAEQIVASIFFHLGIQSPK